MAKTTKKGGSGAASKAKARVSVKTGKPVIKSVLDTGPLEGIDQAAAYNRFGRAYNRFARAYNRFGRAYNRFAR